MHTAGASACRSVEILGVSEKSSTGIFCPRSTDFILQSRKRPRAGPHPSTLWLIQVRIPSWDGIFSSNLNRYHSALSAKLYDRTNLCHCHNHNTECQTRRLRATRNTSYGVMCDNCDASFIRNHVRSPSTRICLMTMITTLLLSLYHGNGYSTFTQSRAY